MKVRLLLFAQYRDLAGTDELELELPAGATASEALDRLRDHTGINGLPFKPALAINQAYAPVGAVLQDGDELALIPPVAGG